MNSLRCFIPFSNIFKLSVPRLNTRRISHVLYARTASKNLKKSDCCRHFSTAGVETCSNTEVVSLSETIQPTELEENEYEDFELTEPVEKEWPPLVTADDVIMSAKNSTEIMNSIPDHNKLTEVVEYLYNNGANCVSIVKMVKQQPHLVMVPIQKWHSTVGYLHENGFSVSHVADMFSLCPAVLLNVTQSSIDEVLNTLRMLAIGEKQMIRVLRSRPVLLLWTAKELKTRIERLKNIFAMKDIRTMLPYCVNLFTEDFDSLEYKVHFILFKMGLEQSDIRMSRVLTFPLEFIKTRFEFVHRAGIYTIPHPKRRKEVKNPTLRDIMDTDDVVFASKIAGLSLLEYKVFSALYKQEIVDKENEEPYLPALLKLAYHSKQREMQPLINQQIQRSLDLLERK